MRTVGVELPWKCHKLEQIYLIQKNLHKKNQQKERHLIQKAILYIPQLERIKLHHQWKQFFLNFISTSVRQSIFHVSKCHYWGQQKILQLRKKIPSLSMNAKHAMIKNGLIQPQMKKENANLSLIFRIKNGNIKTL